MVSGGWEKFSNLSVFKIGRLPYLIYINIEFNDKVETPIDLDVGFDVSVLLVAVDDKL